METPRSIRQPCLKSFLKSKAEIAESYQDPEEVLSYYKSNKDMMNQIASLALEEQVVDQLLSSAKVSEVEVSYEDAIKPAQAEQA